MKKIVLIIIMILLSSCKASNKPSVSVNNLNSNINTFEYGSVVKLNDIFNNENIVFTETFLDTSTLGKKEIEIEYQKDNQLFKEKYTFEIVDTTKPLVWLSSSYSVNVGYEKDLAQSIICADNADRNPNCYITGNFDVNKVGSYPLTYVAIDASGNKEEINFTLYVKEEAKKKTNEKNRTKIQDVIEKYKNENTMIGIDVSKYQGNINWEKVKANGVEFAIIRLGTQMYFGKEPTLDPYFKQNIEGALLNGIEVGIYFYSYATKTTDAKMQANYVLDNIKNYQVTLPIAFDWENFSYWNELGINLLDLRSVSNAFQDVIKENGYTPVQYGSKNYLNAFWLPTKYDTWLAHYTANLKPSSYDKSYIMWQICNNGLVEGIDGDVDIDVYYKNN